MTAKEVVRRTLNAYLLGDDSFLNCCKAFIRMKIQEDVFAEFGLTASEVIQLSEIKKAVIAKIEEAH